MSYTSRWPPLLVLAASAVIACGGDKIADDNLIGPPVTTALNGVFVGQGESGWFELTVEAALAPQPTSAPAHASVVPRFASGGAQWVDVYGTLHLEAPPTVPLAGSYDPQTRRIVFDGGGYDFSGDIEADGASGEYGGPQGPGTFAGYPGLVQCYCGRYRANEWPEDQEGYWMVLRGGVTLVGIFKETFGDPINAVHLRGSLEGTQVTLTYEGGHAAGFLVGDEMSGRWGTDESPVLGTWWARECAP